MAPMNSRKMPLGIVGMAILGCFFAIWHFSHTDVTVVKRFRTSEEMGERAETGLLLCAIAVSVVAEHGLKGRFPGDLEF